MCSFALGHSCVGSGVWRTCQELLMATLLDTVITLVICNCKTWMVLKITGTTKLRRTGEPEVWELCGQDMRKGWVSTLGCVSRQMKSSETLLCKVKLPCLAQGWSWHGLCQTCWPLGWVTSPSSVGEVCGPSPCILGKSSISSSLALKVWDRDNRSSMSNSLQCCGCHRSISLGAENCPGSFPAGLLERLKMFWRWWVTQVSTPRNCWPDCIWSKGRRVPWNWRKQGKKGSNYP